MSKGFSVNVEGMDALRRRLENLAAEVQAGARAAIRETATEAREEMKRRVPVDTGALRRNITSRVQPSKLTAEIGPRRGAGVHYAYWVEFGTSSMPAQPFARPAAERAREVFPKNLRKHVGDELKK